VSVYRRIVIAFAVFAAVVAGLTVYLVHGVVHLMEDSVIERQLAAELAHVRHRVEATGALPEPDHALYEYHLGSAAPAELAALGPGIHELASDVDEAHVAVSELANGERLIVRYLEREDPYGDQLQLYSGGAGLVIFLCGLALGLLTARRVTRPLVELAHVVATAPPAALAPALAARRYDREVQGVIERLVENLRAREAYAEREQRFTRFASHELRTPVAVIQGAAELLRLAPEAGEPRVRRPLERIERACADMQATCEALLWLARDVSTVEPPPPIDVAPLVERVVARLEQTKPVAVRVERRGELVVRAPAAVVEIAVHNLLANAYHFTDRGSVTITIDRDALVVTDTGPGMTSAELAAAGTAFARGDASAGYGLGLAIVKTICARFDWTLTLANAETGLRAALEVAGQRREAVPER
jgi:signal transduction histidine kinase